LLERRREHDRYLVVLPRVDVDHLTVGEQLGHAGTEDAEVGAAVLGGFGTGVRGDPHRLADLQLSVLGHLAEQAHGAVFQVGERTVGRAGGVEAVEFLLWLLGQVHCRHADADRAVGELGNSLRQDDTFGVVLPVVPAAILHVVVVRTEPGDVRRSGQIGRADDEQRPAVLLLAVAVDVATPAREAGAVGLLLARLSPHRIGVLGEVEQVRFVQRVLGHW